MKKIAIVHDWLIAPRGAEKILEALVEHFPTADLHVGLYKTPPRAERWSMTLATAKKKMSKLDRSRQFKMRFNPDSALDLWRLGQAIERFDLSAYDLVISSSRVVAKNARKNPQAVHVCYAHAAGEAFASRKQNSWDLWFWLRKLLQKNDELSSSRNRVDLFLCASKWTARKIGKRYGRPAIVVPPFVDAERFLNYSRKPGRHFLLVSDCRSQKEIERAVLAFAASGLPLLIVGSGPHRNRLRRISKKFPHIEWIENVSESALNDLYSKARAVVIPAEEETSQVALEALASGTPVIANWYGGVREIVTEATGILFEEPTADALEKAVMDFVAREQEFSADACRARAAEFTREKFLAELNRQLNGLLETALPTDAASRKTSFPELRIPLS